MVDLQHIHLFDTFISVLLHFLFNLFIHLHFLWQPNIWSPINLWYWTELKHIIRVEISEENNNKNSRWRRLSWFNSYWLNWLEIDQKEKLKFLNPSKIMQNRIDSNKHLKRKCKFSIQEKFNQSFDFKFTNFRLFDWLKSYWNLIHWKITF